MRSEQGLFQVGFLFTSSLTLKPIIQNNVKDNFLIWPLLILGDVCGKQPSMLMLRRKTVTGACGLSQV